MAAKGRYSSERNGMVVINGFSSEASRENVLKLLLASESENENALKRRLRKTPFVLRHDVSFEEGSEIAGYLRSLGAEAEFVTAGQDGTAPFPFFKLLRYTALFAILLLVLAYAWGVYGGRPLPVITPIAHSVGQAVQRLITTLSDTPAPPQPQQTSNASRNSEPAATTPGAFPEEPDQKAAASMYAPFANPPLTLKSAKPADKRLALRLQFAPRPDRRFPMALNALSHMWGALMKDETPLKADASLWDGHKMVVFLKKGTEGLGKLEIALPHSLDDGLATMDAWMGLLEEKAGPLPPEAPEPKAELLATAQTLFLGMNTISMLWGFDLLEALRQEEGLSAELLKSAALGYGLMAVSLYPDMMGYGDTFVGQGLACIALARRLDPGLDTSRELGLLALEMERTSQAQALLQPDAEAGDDLSTLLFSYASGDHAALESFKGTNASLLGRMLLARFFKEQRRSDEANLLATALVKTNLPSLPVLAVATKAGDLGLAKGIIGLPIALAVVLAETNDIPKQDSEKLMTHMMQRITEVASEMNRSPGKVLAQFEDALPHWSPLSSEVAEGVLMDTPRLQLFLRAQYDNALALQFNLLFNRWSVLEKAAGFAESMGTTNPDSPLSVLFMAQINNAMGRRNEAAKHGGKLLSDTSLSVAMTVALKKVLADAVIDGARPSILAQHMDGSPTGLAELAVLCKDAHLLDQSLDMHLEALRLNPSIAYEYSRLARLEGNDARLRQALQEDSGNLQLILDAIWYYDHLHTQATQEKVLSLYDQAIALAPEDFGLRRKRLVQLRTMGRLEEAMQAIEELMATGPTGLDRNNLQSSMSYIYIEQGQPQKVMAYARQQVQSRQALAMTTTALAFEAMGELQQAEEIFGLALKRYPDSHWVAADLAGFYWRNESDEEAARVLAMLRPSAGSDRGWYLKTFCNVLGDASLKRILSAAEALRSNGAHDNEINWLATYLSYMGRFEAASRVLDMLLTQDNQNQIYYRIRRYIYAKEWQGPKKAREELYAGLPPKAMGPLSSVMMVKHEYELALQHDYSNELANPKYREFVHLQRLVAWLALGREPAGLAQEFQEHYASPTTDYYQTIGRYLMGHLSQDTMLALMSGPKQVCEIGYYLGFAARLQGDFKAASEWYAISVSTTLQRNAEYGWAIRELQDWAEAGTSRRLRLPGRQAEEVEQQNKQRFLFSLKEKFKMPPKGSQASLPPREASNDDA